jgi:hypothetical protein
MITQSSKKYAAHSFSLNSDPRLLILKTKKCNGISFPTKANIFLKTPIVELSETIQTLIGVEIQVFPDPCGTNE